LRLAFGPVHGLCSMLKRSRVVSPFEVPVLLDGDQLLT
jgi:hypothetical protein